MSESTIVGIVMPGGMVLTTVIRNWQIKAVQTVEEIQLLKLPKAKTKFWYTGPALVFTFLC